nr:structure-specific endonuclease subunit SLX4-like [Nerophis lumbriciformis]
MNDSDQDFVDLCSKLLKRSRKKGVETKQKRSDQASSQAKDGDHERYETVSEHHRVTAQSQTGHAHQVMGITVKGEHHPRVVLAPEQTTENACGAKEKLIIRMQEFKRVCPKMVNNMEHGKDSSPSESEIVQPSTSDGRMCPQDSDEALAICLQQQLDREAAEVHTTGLAAESLFFCHICHRDLSHMTPEGRTQHINRCLDGSEHQMAAPPVPHLLLGVPDCPICGKKFKSHKSRSTHLKRCSTAMGVSPAVLLQALQRQAEETQLAAANTVSQPGGTKRKGVTQAGPAGRKKPRKKTDILDEDTMMALALSSSLLEQEREQLNAAKAQTTAADSSMTSVLKWRPDAGKGCTKKKKGTVPRPPPILLIQDPDAALTRLQERVSNLLLRTRAPSPPTPTRCPSTVSALSGATPLWQKSALLTGNSCVLDFFVPELRDFITPWEAAQVRRCRPLCTLSQPNAKACITPSSTPSTPAAGQLPANSQALQDLVDLSDNEIATDQGEHIAPDTGQDQNASFSANFQMSGFFLEEIADVHVALSNLASNLSSMVNNPQLSDWQLQVDSGEVFFAHSFMIYARCPLLAEMMHESGFGVHEEGMPAAHRVLISDVPGQAVLILLEYLYSASVSLPASLQPHVLELASRFDLQELRQLCELHTEDPSAQNDDGAAMSPTERLNKTDMALTALFKSMWSHEDDADQEGNDENGLEKAADETSCDRELPEEQVNEEELDEIYEFAATQRKRDEETVMVEESEGDDGELTEPRETPERFCDKILEPESDKFLDRNLENSCNRIFSDSDGVYKKDSSSSTPPRAHIPTTPISTLSGRNLLHSSASIGSGSSPNTSNLPVPGVSPDRDRNCCTIGVKEVVREQEPLEHCTPPKCQSQVSGGIHVLLPPNSRHKNEPELIVLSGSSEEMEVFNAEPCSQSPILTHSHAGQSFTHLKSREPSVEMEQTRNLECNITDISPSPKQLSPADCSPELSWLIPSTPISPSPIKTSMESSSQTKISSFRTKLFPEENELDSAEVDLVFAEPKPKTHLQLHVDPYSSTPTHFDVVHNHVRPNTSFLDTEPDKQKSFSPEHKSPERMQFESFHLSPLSDPSARHSSTSHRSLPSSERVSKYSSLSPARSRSHDSTGVKTKPIPELDDDKEVGGREKTASPHASFEQSLLIMDDPPIAFNDSWGLDACDDIAGNPGCFSPRLEESSQYQEPKNLISQPSTSKNCRISPSTPDKITDTPPDLSDSLLVANMQDYSGEEEEILPLSQRLNLKTPPSSRIKSRHTLVPITPMPHFSDMDTPELKNKLNSFGVRALPKRQMILKLKEIHQYTHQLVNSDSDEEALPVGNGAQTKAPPCKSLAAEQEANFKEPRVPASLTLAKHTREDEGMEPLSNSQDSNSSSVSSLDESERHNPELCPSSGGESDSDGGISASQAATRLQDRLQAVRTFILSDSSLYTQILQYQPLVLSKLQERLKAAGIRLGAAKLVSFLDSQCITFTTAKPGQPAHTRRRVKKKGTIKAARK